MYLPTYWAGSSTVEDSSTTIRSMLPLPAVPVVVLIGVERPPFLGVQDGSGREADGALDELRAAYARGDVSDAEFEKRRDRPRWRLVSQIDLRRYAVAAPTSSRTSMATTGRG